MFYYRLNMPDNLQRCLLDSLPFVQSSVIVLLCVPVSDASHSSVFVHKWFFLIAVIFQTLCSKWQTRKVEKCAADMHIWWGLLLVRKNEDALNSAHPPESLCYSPEQRNRPRVLKPPIFIHIKCLSPFFFHCIILLCQICYTDSNLRGTSFMWRSWINGKK